ncbi:hypothetical protein FQR65_LT19549 [Abscondita terminalis]|nr:hypothetical protein FQR65_LT19549 [Abscondita terminalis]
MEPFLWNRVGHKQNSGYFNSVGPEAEGEDPYLMMLLKLQTGGQRLLKLYPSYEPRKYEDGNLNDPFGIRVGYHL